VFRRAGRHSEFLLLHRAPGTYMAGTWSVVYGGTKPGETAWQAALREMREETELSPVRLYGLTRLATFYEAGGDTIWHCPLFAAEVEPDADVRLNREHDEFAWLEPDAAASRLPWPQQHEAVREVAHDIIPGGPAAERMMIAIDQA
jgi:dATP pyrophosphohydrolase